MHRLPDPAHPDLLAQISLTGPTSVRRCTTGSGAAAPPAPASPTKWCLNGHRNPTYPTATSATPAPSPSVKATPAPTCTPSDAPQDSLRAGEALSACWLKATDLGVAVLPLSSVVEVPATREVLHRMLAGVGQPMLVLRFGMADPDQPPITQTRLPGERVVREGRFPKP